jgi:hypothetical protein
VTWALRINVKPCTTPEMCGTEFWKFLQLWELNVGNLYWKLLTAGLNVLRNTVIIEYVSISNKLIIYHRSFVFMYIMYEVYSKLQLCELPVPSLRSGGGRKKKLKRKL